MQPCHIEVRAEVVSIKYTNCSDEFASFPLKAHQLKNGLIACVGFAEDVARVSNQLVATNDDGLRSFEALGF